MVALPPLNAQSPPQRRAVVVTSGAPSNCRYSTVTSRKPVPSSACSRGTVCACAVIAARPSSWPWYRTTRSPMGQPPRSSVNVAVTGMRPSPGVVSSTSARVTAGGVGSASPAAATRRILRVTGPGTPYRSTPRTCRYRVPDTVGTTGTVSGPAPGAGTVSQAVGRVVLPVSAYSTVTASPPRVGFTRNRPGTPTPPRGSPATYTASSPSTGTVETLGGCRIPNRHDATGSSASSPSTRSRVSRV